MPEISIVNHVFNDHLESARRALFAMREYFSYLLEKGVIERLQKDQLMARFKQFFDIIYNIPFSSRLPGYPSNVAFDAKKALRLIMAFNVYVKRQIDSNSFKKFDEISYKLMVHVANLIKELSDKTIANSSASFAKAYEKILNKFHLREHLNEMRSALFSIDLRYRRNQGLSFQEVSDAQRKILDLYKALTPAIVSLSDLVAAATRSQSDLKSVLMKDLFEIKEERSRIKNRIEEIHKEVLARRKEAYKRSLSSGKAGEFNRNTGFSEKGRFGGLDLDSRLMIDRDFRRAYIKRYIDKKVRAYLKRLKAIR